MAPKKAVAESGSPKKAGKKALSKSQLRKLVEEATVDAHDEEEQVLGISTMIEENLALPFETEVLGMAVEVVEVELTRRHDIVAICARGRNRQAIHILDLPAPSPPPPGWEWVEAYRHWF